jgi:hypothetical protein
MMNGDRENEKKEEETKYEGQGGRIETMGKKIITEELERNEKRKFK